MILGEESCHNELNEVHRVRGVPDAVLPEDRGPAVQLVARADLGGCSVCTAEQLARRDDQHHIGHYKVVPATTAASQWGSVGLPNTREGKRIDVSFQPDPECHHDAIRHDQLKFKPGIFFEIIKNLPKKCIQMDKVYNLFLKEFTFRAVAFTKIGHGPFSPPSALVMDPTHLKLDEVSVSETC